MKKLKLNSANELDRQIAECFIGSIVTNKPYSYETMKSSILVGVVVDFITLDEVYGVAETIIVDLESELIQFNPFTALKYDLSVSVALGLGRVLTGKPNLPFGYYGTLTKEILINPSKVSLDLEYYKDLIIL